MSQIIISNLSWNRPDGSTLFKNLNYSFNQERTGLIGVNGAGKSTLIKIITGQIHASDGSYLTTGKIKSLPQNQEMFDSFSVVEVLGQKVKYDAYNQIISGVGTSDDYEKLADDWEIENRITEVLEITGLHSVNPQRMFLTLSGGERVKCIIASLLIDKPDFIILDEPTNHLDAEAREFIYNFIREWKNGMIVISHDRKLLRLMNRTVELTDKGLKTYGGNYDFYVEQRKIEDAASSNKLQSATAEFQKNLLEQKRTLAIQEKRTSTAKKNLDKSGLPKILLNKRKGSGEKTLSRLTQLHDDRVENSKQQLEEFKKQTRSKNQIKIDLTQPVIHNKKIIVKAEGINFSFPEKETLWRKNLTFEIRGAEHVLLKGKNGSGKTTLIEMITGKKKCDTGKIFIGVNRVEVFDQSVSLLNNNLTLLENIKLFSGGKLKEHELRIRLGRFLFYKDNVHKKAGVLSGGERMRAGLACLLASDNAPELLILDEPTNNLDIESVERMNESLKNYEGAIIIVSHDEDFINEIGIDSEIDLDAIF